MYLNPKGRDWGSLVNWDDLGKLYAGLLVAWSTVLFAGVGWLLWNRRMPFVRMRNLPIALLSTFFLHLYLIKIMMAYTTNGHFLCSAEFWIMSIYLPFGIALFQANVTQLRSISDRQEKLLTRQLSFNRTSELPSQNQYRHFLCRWREFSEAQKSYVFIAIGLLVQLVMTAVLYATTPELQGDWSSYGSLPHNKGQGLCRKSLQWIPSAFWQLFWTWIYGPYELYKIRKIRDAHRWRLQTVLCIMASLPGVPLWIAALYTKTAFMPVNRWFVPPMWLAPGIIVMQFATIFFPIFEIMEHRRSMHKTLNSTVSDSMLRSSFSFSENNEKDSHTDSANTLFDELQASSAGRLYSLGALERALLINPAPLLHYAATQDFTAENIIFLTEVKCWHEAWKAAPRTPGTYVVTEDARVRLFQMAVEIFITSIHEKTAEFPINIEGYIRKELTDIFGPAVPEGQRESGESGRVRPADSRFGIGPDNKHDIDLNRMNDLSATIWDDKKQPTFVTIAPSSSSMLPASPNTTSTSPFSSAGTTPDVNAVEENPFTFDSHPGVSPLGKGRAKIRPGFDEHVFDAAEASIKYLVLTNTWRKFVELREKEQQQHQQQQRISYDV